LEANVRFCRWSVESSAVLAAQIESAFTFRDLSSLREGGAKTLAATVTARVIVMVADWERNGTSGGRDDRDGLTPIYQRSRPHTTTAQSADRLDKITGRLTSRLCYAGRAYGAPLTLRGARSQPGL
jgi:hypothetical protein